MVDAGFAEDEQLKSHGGCFMFLGDNMLQYYSRPQKGFATSTGEAEFNEIFRSTTELLFIQQLLEEFNYAPRQAILFTDAMAAMAMI